MEHKAASGAPDEGILKEAAKAVGSAAGKVVAKAKALVPHEAPASPAKVKTPKLPAKNKARLPRKEKKKLAAQKKRAAA